MSYLGVPPFGQTVRTVTTVTATTSQTSFTPTGGYTVGYCDVFYNGVKLVAGTDFTASDGLTVVLTAGATSGAVVEIITYGSVTITDAVRRSGDTFAGAVAINSTLAAGNTTITGTLSASANVNLDSGTLFVDGVNNRVGINNTAPTSALTVTGNAAFSNTVAITGATTLSANVILGTTTITANGGVGTSGQVLTSGASGNAYWSTIAASFSNGQSISVANVSVTNTITFADSTAMSSSPVGFKNRIINGGMTIAQRGTTFTNCINTYTLDRYYCYGGPDTGITVSQQTDTNFVSGKCVRFGRAAGDTYTNNIGLAYSMETIDSLPLRGRVVTLSFTAYKGANFSGTLGMYLQYGTGTDEKSVSYTGGTVAGSVGPTLTTTATRYSFTATIPSNANEVGFYFSYTPTGTAGAADYFNMGDIQLELGSTATPFEIRPYGLELNLCKRYYQILASNNRIDVMRYTGTSATVYIPYSVEMRTTPTFSLTRNSSVYGSVNTGAGQGGLDPESQNQYGMSLYVYTTSVPDQAGVKATVLASAEL